MTILWFSQSLKDVHIIMGKMHALCLLLGLVKQYACMYIMRMGLKLENQCIKIYII